MLALKMPKKLIFSSSFCFNNNQRFKNLTISIFILRIQRVKTKLSRPKIRRQLVTLRFWRQPVETTQM